MKPLATAVVALGLAVMPLLPAQAQLSQAFVNYECMSLAHLWSGSGPMPPPVPEYAAPPKGAAQIGTAMSTVIVDRPPYIENGRLRVIRPDGTAAWIDRNEVTTWHVVSNPSARCSVVRLANGRIGTYSK